MSSKSYADAVSGSSSGEESVAKLSNTFWRKYQVEDEEDAFTKAIENSKVSTKCHVNLDIQPSSICSATYQLLFLAFRLILMYTQILLSSLPVLAQATFTCQPR